jgi:hypothetical protein
MHTKRSFRSYRNSTAPFEDSQPHFRMNERKFERKIIEKMTHIRFLSLLTDKKIEEESPREARLLFSMAAGL